MTAKPADIATFTNDGVVLSIENATILDRFPEAETVDLETLFDRPEDAQAMLEERFGVRAMVGRIHDSIEISSRLDLGTTIAIAPRIPAFNLIDTSRSIAGRTCIRAYSFLYETDRYALELVGMPGRAYYEKLTVDSTLVTVDDTTRTVDQN